MFFNKKTKKPALKKECDHDWEVIGYANWFTGILSKTTSKNTPMYFRTKNQAQKYFISVYQVRQRVCLKCGKCSGKTDQQIKQYFRDRAHKIVARKRKAKEIWRLTHAQD